MNRQSPLRSWLIGGFESATMTLDTGRRVDAIAASGHDRNALRDYTLLGELGIRTVRDSLRWHLIEAQPGRYSWHSVLPQLRAAEQAGMQIVWDVLHFGLPAWIDVWSPDFKLRFADFAEAAARLVATYTDDAPVWCPINEISYWALAGGELGHFVPLGMGRGCELKRILTSAWHDAAMRLRQVDRRALMLQPEPVIHVGADQIENSIAAEHHRTAMYETWDLLTGLSGDRTITGSPDLIGVNFYPNNQWMSEGRRLGMGDIGYRPFAQILAEVWERYRRPIVVSETGAEGANLRGWLRYVTGEVADAQAMGVPILGLCIYPIMDYPGWTDDRHCPCGVIQVSEDWEHRHIRQDTAGLLRDLLRPVASIGGT